MSNTQHGDSLIGKSLDGYQITGFIARGGMGEVYRGIQKSLDRPVAIKVLSPRFSAYIDFQQRFEREARVASRLDHPNAVRILDFGVVDATYFMVLELIEGDTLRDLLGRLREQGRSMPLNQAVSITRQVGGALSAAHALGFVHRDVKPGNVLFRRDGQPVLADFGVVKVLEMSDLTTPGTLFGVPRYKAPEEFKDAESIGPATDQYALAVIAYEMIAGRPPFDAPTPSEMMLKHVSEPPAPPSAHVTGLPHGVDLVLGRALAKDPGDRYPSVERFVEQLGTAAATTAEEAERGQAARAVSESASVVRPRMADQRRPASRLSSVALIVAIFIVAVVAGFAVILGLLLLLG